MGFIEGDYTPQIVFLFFKIQYIYSTASCVNI